MQETLNMGIKKAAPVWALPVIRDLGPELFGAVGGGCFRGATCGFVGGAEEFFHLANGIVVRVDGYQFVHIRLHGGLVFLIVVIQHQVSVGVEEEAVSYTHLTLPTTERV